MNILEFDAKRFECDTAREKLIREYLVSNGWKYTSAHPGSIWLWTYEEESTKHVDDETIVTRKTYAVDESTAVQFQRYWELEGQHFASHSDECAIFETHEFDDCDCGGDA